MSWLGLMGQLCSGCTGFGSPRRNPKPVGTSPAARFGRGWQCHTTRVRAQKQSCQSQGRKQKNVHRAAGGAGGAAHIPRLRALGASTMPVGQEAVGQLQRETPPKQQTLINFYFCFFRRDLLFISALMYLIISSKGKSSGRWGHSWGNFSAEYFMENKCNFQPFALDRKCLQTI